MPPSSAPRSTSGAASLPRPTAAKCSSVVSRRAPSSLTRSPPGTSEEDLDAAILGAEEHVWRGIVAEAHGRKVLVGGFSQGAIVAYALAARHPEIVYTFPIAGLLPASLIPHDHTPTAPVFAMHGTDDDVIEVDLGRATVAAFQADGAKAELQEFPGVGHEIAPAMRQELARRVQVLLPALQ
jgi:predicted esterase